MARPRKDTPPELFTSTDVAVAAGLSPRNFSLLTDRGYAPPAEDEVSGKSVSRLYGQRAFARCALIAALHRSGIDLLLAARLTEEVAEEIEPNHRTLPSRLYDIWYGLPKELRTKLPSDRIETEYWLHDAVSKSSEYKPGETVRGDLIIDIVNGKYVLTRTMNFLRTHSPVSKEGLEADPLCMIERMERGAEVAVTTFAEQMGGRFDYNDDEVRKRWKEIETEYLAAWKNFESRLTVNISLSIRNAYDNLKKYRATKG